MEPEICAWPLLKLSGRTLMRLRAAAAFGGRHVQHFQAVANVVRDAHVREQRIGLEYDTNIAVLNGRFGYVFTVNENLSGGWVFKTGNQTQDGRFTATGWPKQRHHGAAFNG